MQWHPCEFRSPYSPHSGSNLKGESYATRSRPISTAMDDRCRIRCLKNALNLSRHEDWLLMDAVLTAATSSLDGLKETTLFYSHDFLLNVLDRVDVRGDRRHAFGHEVAHHPGLRSCLTTDACRDVVIATDVDHLIDEREY